MAEDGLKFSKSTMTISHKDANTVYFEHVPQWITTVIFHDTKNMDWSSLQFPERISHICIDNCGSIDFNTFPHGNYRMIGISDTDIHNISKLQDISMLQCDITCVKDTETPIILPQGITNISFCGNMTKDCDLTRFVLPTYLKKIEIGRYNELKLHIFPAEVKEIVIQSIETLDMSQVQFPHDLEKLMLPISHQGNDINLGSNVKVEYEDEEY